jgi:hypothetical protein
MSTWGLIINQTVLRSLAQVAECGDNVLLEDMMAKTRLCFHFSP